MGRKWALGFPQSSYKTTRVKVPISPLDAATSWLFDLRGAEAERFHRKWLVHIGMPASEWSAADWQPTAVLQQLRCVWNGLP